MASGPAAGLDLDGFAAPWPYPLPVGQQQRAEPEQQLVDEGNHVRHEDIADEQRRGQQEQLGIAQPAEPAHQGGEQGIGHDRFPRSEEHTSELQPLMRISYAVFCLKNEKNIKTTDYTKESHT